jgi:hypothetical protein
MPLTILLQSAGIREESASICILIDALAIWEKLKPTSTTIESYGTPHSWL